MSERKLASIQRIIKLEPIENADQLELATILGWQCVVRKGEFLEGQLICFFEIDSLIPYNEWSKFLFQDKISKIPPGGVFEGNHRLKTVKLRGQISQGLVVPLNILPDSYKIQIENFTDEELLGTDITEILGIKKYEPYISASLQGICKSTFPSWIPKTDEERIQSAPWILDQYANVEVIVTEKLDGCSSTFYLKDGEFGVCSRNMDLKESPENAYWQIARTIDLENKMRLLGKNIAIQGELIGQGIQSNKYHLTKKEFYVYNIYNIDTQKYYSFQEACDLIHQMELYFVPVVSPSMKLQELGSLEDLIKYSNQNSLINTSVIREGIVIRSVENIQIYKFGRFSFKVINSNFLLKYGE